MDSRAPQSPTAGQRLKVLFISSWYPSSENPLQGIFVREHAKAVALANDVVVLHCAGPANGQQQLWRLTPETNDDFSVGIPLFRVHHWPIRIPRVSYGLFSWSVIQAFQHIVAKGFRPDIIHAHIYDAGFPAVLISRKSHIPLIITEHLSAFPRRLLSRDRVWVARFAFRAAKYVLPVSQALQKGMEAQGIRARFSIIPNVVDLNMFFPRARPRPSGPVRLLFVGSMIPVKGLPNLLHALAFMGSERVDWHLDTVGDGAFREEYERLSANLGLAGKVTFHGLKTQAEVADFMRKADLFVLPSLWENLPCVLLEAMASGLPIVATRAGGIPEIVDREVGWLVPPGDTGKLAEALATRLDSPAWPDSQVLVQKAQRYSPDVVARSIHAIYLASLRP